MSATHNLVVKFAVNFEISIFSVSTLFHELFINVLFYFGICLIAEIVIISIKRKFYLTQRYNRMNDEVTKMNNNFMQIITTSNMIRYIAKYYFHTLVDLS